MILFKRVKKYICSFTATVICLLSFFCLGGCSKTEKTALKLNGVNIPGDVYAYFIDKAFSESKEELSYEAAEKQAVKLVATYFKINTLARNSGILLTPAQKASVSEDVNAKWAVYGKYYTSVGVTKETLTKVFSADAYRRALINYYYGKGGKNEISLARLYAAFKTNYIVFQSINGYLTFEDADGFIQQYDDVKREALILKFQNMASLVNAGEKTMEDAAKFLSESGYSCSVSTVVLKKDDSGYPDGFFEKVKSLKARTATVIGTTEHKYIFLVIRGDASADSEYFNSKREEIINDIAADEIDERIEKSYSVKSDIKVGESQGIYYLVKTQRSK